MYKQTCTVYQQQGYGNSKVNEGFSQASKTLGKREERFPSLAHFYFHLKLGDLTEEGKN